MRLAPLAAPATALLAAALAAGCGAGPVTTTRQMTDATRAAGAAEPATPGLPELDLAAPDDFATATFALGWFWGPDSRFGGLDGVLRTRVGYAGGTTPAPTYRAIGDHSEAIQVDFDPRVISYEQLLDVFFASHNACRAPFSRQYRSAILVASGAQRAAAERAARAHEGERGGRLATAIEPLGDFTLAEDYHQKYRLRRESGLMAELERRYPTLDAFVDSPTVTRLNAFVAGHGDAALRARDLPRMGLPAPAIAKLRGDR